MTCSRAHGRFQRLAALTAMALSALAANGATLPVFALAERAADPLSKSPSHSRFMSTGKWELREAPAPEEMRPEATRSLNGARGSNILATPATSADQPPGTGHDARLTQLQPIAGRWASDPAWMQSARKVRQQGVPILRPWQNSRMFISLGVNAKGVPGIYLVQKTAR